MDTIIELTTLNFSSIFISVFVILIGLKAIVSLLEWFIEKLGLETKWMRNKKKEHELLLRTSENLAKLQEKHSLDVEQSKREFSDFIKSITNANKIKDKQIDSLMVANRELLAEKINDKYKYYISVKGIPEDEVEEFTNLHTAYKGCGGNHSGDAKYEYCINHLPVIPVETKLVYEKE